MYKINLVVVGKVKEKYFLEGIDEYSKRLSRFADFSIIELAEENFTKVDDKLIETIKEREADKILSKIKGRTFVFAIEGKKFSSESFARLVKSECDAHGVVNFVIGGSYGVSDRVKNVADGLISFSDMTFPHTLFRLMVTEQIYRAFSINANSPYHK